MATEVKRESFKQLADGIAQLAGDTQKIISDIRYLRQHIKTAESKLILPYLKEIEEMIVSTADSLEKKDPSFFKSFNNLPDPVRLVIAFLSGAIALKILQIIF